jgi:cytidine deaminase
VVDEDERRNATELSQDVLNTFPKADFFVSQKADVSGQIKRFVELIFGEPFTTPTADEYLMFMAQAASRRSADLSRQVGAIISDGRDAVVSAGCNDVPYPTGGIYYEGRRDAKSKPVQDNRDHTVEFDPNASEILNSLKEIVRGFKSAGLLGDEVATKDEDQLAQELMHGSLKPHLADARVRNLIEFGRVVHAEMNAITEAARLGRQTQGGTLYCTTFPCHICARHIIAAGIMRVVFIEPYTKSMTKELYADEIATDDSPGKLQPPVRFQSFSGVAPRLYQRVFDFRPRKNRSGTIVIWNREKALPREAVSGVADETQEEKFSGQVDQILALVKPQQG